MAVNDFDLSGRRALVTGGGDGLGRQFTEALVDAGADVYICGRRPEPLTEAANALSARGTVTPVVADITDETQLRRLVDTVSNIDILVNNAGKSHIAPWLDVSHEEWRKIMALNVDAPFRLAQEFVPGMVEAGWGRIVNIASVYALLTPEPARYPGQSIEIASYVTSKHALLGLTKYLAAELGTTGVTVNAICPGMFPSPATADLIAPAVGRALSAGAPIGRLGNDTDLRTALLFLTATSSSFVTGQSIAVDGGWSTW